MGGNGGGRERWCKEIPVHGVDDGEKGETGGTEPRNEGWIGKSRRSRMDGDGSADRAYVGIDRHGDGEDSHYRKAGLHDLPYRGFFSSCRRLGCHCILRVSQG